MTAAGWIGLATFVVMIILNIGAMFRVYGSLSTKVEGLGAQVENVTTTMTALKEETGEEITKFANAVGQDLQRLKTDVTRDISAEVRILEHKLGGKLDTAQVRLEGQLETFQAGQIVINDKLNVEVGRVSLALDRESARTDERMRHLERAAGGRSSRP